MSQPDMILLNVPQYEAIESVRDTYRRAGKEITFAEAFAIWLRRGSPVEVSHES